MDGAQAGDNLLLYFSGYGTQFPAAAGAAGGVGVQSTSSGSSSNGGSAYRSNGGPNGEQEAFILPCDFADSLPEQFLQQPVWDHDYDRVGHTGALRMISMRQIAQRLQRLPAGCRCTLVFDSAFTQLPVLRGSGGSSTRSALISADNNVKGFTFGRAQEPVGSHYLKRPITSKQVSTAHYSKPRKTLILMAVFLDIVTTKISS